MQNLWELQGDCGSCRFCQDMIKFGVKGILQQCFGEKYRQVSPKWPLCCVAQ